MYRTRFKIKTELSKPVKWPIPHPYWVTGFCGEGYAALVAYHDTHEQLVEQWPEAEMYDSEEVEGYQFSSRFPKPDWLA